MRSAGRAAARVVNPNGAPLLAPLLANGGPTGTRALLAGAVAIGAGLASACPPGDQRGCGGPRPGPATPGAYQRRGAPDVSP